MFRLGNEAPKYCRDSRGPAKRVSLVQWVWSYRACIFTPPCVVLVFLRPVERIVRNFHKETQFFLGFTNGALCRALLVTSAQRNA